MSTPGNSLGSNEFGEFTDLLISKLALHWKAEDRVSAVNLVVQAAKILTIPSEMSTSNVSNYPAAFFLVTDITSYFGNLVHDRLG